MKAARALLLLAVGAPTLAMASFAADLPVQPSPGWPSTNCLVWVITNGLSASGPAPFWKAVPGARTNRFLVLTNRPATACLPGGKEGTLAATRPAPGIYESAPYTCIVVVPGEHPDERAIIVPPDVRPRMPTISPEFRLIPRKSN